MYLNSRDTSLWFLIMLYIVHAFSTERKTKIKRNQKSRNCAIEEIYTFKELKFSLSWRLPRDQNSTKFATQFTLFHQLLVPRYRLLWPIQRLSGAYMKSSRYLVSMIFIQIGDLDPSSKFTLNSQFYGNSWYSLKFQFIFPKLLIRKDELIHRFRDLFTCTPLFNVLFYFC